MKIVKRIFKHVRWDLARLCLQLQPGLEVIGIAGSVGKTTTKEFIAQILQQQFKTVKTEANFDPIFNLPITALKSIGANRFIAEMGVDGVGQMDKYLTLVHPKIGVLTRLSLEHTDKNHFGSFENAILEELQLIKSLPKKGWAIINEDDANIVQRVDENSCPANIVRYGFGKNADIKITNFSHSIKNGKAQSTFTVTRNNGESKTFITNLLGKTNALCAVAGIAVGIIENISSEKIQKGLSQITPVPGRLEPKKWLRGIVIDDSYNASPEAVKAAVDVLISLDPNGILVLGDMLELGKYSKDEHKAMGKYARDSGVKKIAVYGENAPFVLQGFGLGENALLAKNHEEIIVWLKKQKSKTILVKGSHGMRMEKVVEGIIKQE